MIKFLLSDNESLANYAHGKFVSLEDVKRRMLLKARVQNPNIPDHLYRLQQKETFRKIDSLSDIFTIGLAKISEEYLELQDNKIYVIPQHQNSWQDTITYIPPLLLQCALLHKNTYTAGLKNSPDRYQYFKKYLLPNSRYTSIPRAKIPQLDYFVKHQNGLHDLHMHLNGALETDQVWQDFLFNPKGIYEDLLKGFQTQKVREQMEQESYLLEPLQYVTLLTAAQKLRTYFYYFLYPYNNSGYENLSREILLSKFVSFDSEFPGSYKHPFSALFNESGSLSSLMSVEGFMYILLLEELRKTNNELLACFFHFYLLILGLTNRLLVQQTHQNGFEQFQKHTLNGLRENSEKIFLRRYYQMHGNDLDLIRFLEGRFSPKDSQHEMINFLQAIEKGWKNMVHQINENFADESRVAFITPELKLIAHFIKKADTRPDAFIRHKKLRSEVANKGKILALLLKNHSQYRKKIVAVDAAASEFDAPPEVFAPVFRKMRRSGVKHFTYHAGEDFHHLISGIRSIYEAIEFCDLQRGDRIGHAVASALSPLQWQQCIGPELLVKKGDYLDDLVFSYHLIVKRKIESLHNILPFIINKVNELSYDIYNQHYPIAVLEQAWLMRQCCPMHALEQNRENMISKSVYDEHEWSYMIDKGFAKNRVKNPDDKVLEVFEIYHNVKYRNKFDKIISINPFNILKAEHIESLQLSLLHEMTLKEIVIETLPTSNVRIGFHKNFSTYHLINWITWHEQGKSIPPIVVGSDDTGIFATNIYNEYANIYCMLLNTYNLPHAKVMDVIERLDKDSHIYRFE